jgi:2-polyprenyl-6-methoxyphenol hydroxylase-like FAD-dependent oxidoreductase
MRINVVGGGPAGLFFSYLWKMRHPDDGVVLFEQNRADITGGFGIVFADRALDFLRTDHPLVVDLISRKTETWRDLTLDVRGQRVKIDGVGFSAIGRLALLQLLQALARDVGVEMRFNARRRSMEELMDAEVVVGADGLNSFVRRSHESEFGTSLNYTGNKFAWFGTTCSFDTLTQTFVQTDHGTFNAHHYRYSPEMSTFLVECDPATWQRYGFASKTSEETKMTCEAVFAATLQGHGLISNNSVWRQFPWVWNQRWHCGNAVLIGDALHTAHFSIGSGTRLAMEDAIALGKALETEDTVERAFAHYQSTRLPIVRALVEASRTSADWYEQFPARMQLEPLEFAYSYITRSGRIDDDKLRGMSPGFMKRRDGIPQMKGSQ